MSHQEGTGCYTQTFYYITPVEVTPGVSASWETVDLSAYLPAGATGAIMRFKNVNESNPTNTFGLRMPGSTDNVTDLIYNNAQLWAMSGVDAGRNVEVTLGDVTTMEAWVTGYTTAGVTFFTNGIDKSLGSTNTWLPIDISADPGGDTAIGAIVEIDGVWQKDFGLRKKGSSDEVFVHGRHIWTLVGVDGSEIFEDKVNSTSYGFFVVGYVTAG